MTPRTALMLAWVAWLIPWVALGVFSSRTVARAGTRAETLYRIVTALGAFLLFAFRPRRWLLWNMNTALAWSMLGVAIIGLGFTWWARLHLGRLWSSTVTRKADHEVIDTGPYALVRHPIYSGIILALVATALQSGTAAGLLGTGLMIAGFYIKARLEERFLREQLGEENYGAYARRVPMLVPGMPTGRGRGRGLEFP